MGLAESLPFPRYRLQPEQMSQDHGVGPRMGDDDHSFVRVVDCPKMAAVVVHWGNSMSGQRLLEAAHDTQVEVTE